MTTSLLAIHNALGVNPGHAASARVRGKEDRLCRFVTRLALLVLAAAALAGAVWAQGGGTQTPNAVRSRQQAYTGARALQDLYDKYKDSFRGVYGGESVGETTRARTLALCESELLKLQNLEANALPEIERVMERVTRLWSRDGAEAEAEARAKGDFDPLDFALNQSGGIEWNLKMAATGNDNQKIRELPEEFSWASSRYGDISRWMYNVRRTRVSNGEYLANGVKNAPKITEFAQNIRVKVMKEWKTLLGWALRFDPANEYANARMVTIDREIADVEKLIEAEIDAKQWAGQMAGFSGPGSATALSRSAMDYFRKDKEWGNMGSEPVKNDDGSVRRGVEILAVVVRGPWQVAEKDIFGRVLSWRLPIHLAITKPDLKAKNVARVYELSMVTKKGIPNRVAKAPPFDGYWVGNSWMMRLNKVPRGR